MLGSRLPLTLSLKLGLPRKAFFVILSEAKDLVSPYNDGILRSLRSLRMTVKRTFLEVSTLNIELWTLDLRI
jgi:hypothetical protein